MFMKKFMDIMQAIGKYKTTNNIFKKLYYRLQIIYYRKDIINYVVDRPLYELLVEFASVFHNIKDIQDHDTIMIYTNEDCSVFTINIHLDGNLYTASVDCSHPENGIDLAVVPDDIHIPRYAGNIPAMPTEYTNEVVFRFTYIAKLAISNTIYTFCDLNIRRRK